MKCLQYYLKGTKANALLDILQQGKAVLGAPLTGELSRTLLPQTQTGAGMNNAVGCVRTTYQSRRNQHTTFIGTPRKRLTFWALKPIEIPHLWINDHHKNSQ